MNENLNRSLKESQISKTKKGEGGRDTICFCTDPEIGKNPNEEVFKIPPFDLSFEVELDVQASVMRLIESLDWAEGAHESKRVEVMRYRMLKAGVLVSIINHVYWGSMKKYKSRDEFIPLSAEILRSVIGHDYKMIVDRLMKAGVIQRTESYRVSTPSRQGACKKYRLNPDLVGGPCEILYIDPLSRFGCRIQDAFELGRTRPLESPSHELIRKNTFRLKFSDRAKVVYVLEISGKSEDGLQSQMYNIRSISRPSRVKGENSSSFTTDAYGRIYSSFSNLFREARPYLRLDGHPLVCLDLHASHWFHALMLWGEQDSGDFGVLSEELSKGDLYQALSDRLGGDSRDAIKLPSLRFLHAHPDWMAKEARPIANALKEMAPSFAEWIKEEKLRVASQDGGVKAFSWRLLREESNRINVDAVGALMKLDPDYPVITLHDALYVPEGREGEALGVLKSVYETAYGIIPKISSESPEEKIIDFVDPYQFGIDEEAEAEAA